MCRPEISDAEGHSRSSSAESRRSIVQRRDIDEEQLPAVLREAAADRRADPAIEEVEEAISDAAGLTRAINAWEGRWPLNTYARDMDRNKLSRHMQERLAQAELRALRAQISPHFIYNALAAASVNIATFHLGRTAPGEDAIALIAVDQKLTSSLIDAVRRLPNVIQATAMRF